MILFSYVLILITTLDIRSLFSFKNRKGSLNWSHSELLSLVQKSKPDQNFSSEVGFDFCGPVKINLELFFPESQILFLHDERQKFVRPNCFGVWLNQCRNVFKEVQQLWLCFNICLEKIFDFFLWGKKAKDFWTKFFF